MDPEPELNPKARQELVNLQLTEEKLRQELLDLRRPYLFRNPQLFTAFIASVGAIVGALVLISGNYYNVQRERNALLADETKRMNEDSLRAKKDADATKSAAETTRAQADKAKKEADAIKEEAEATKSAAEITKAEADIKVRDSNHEIEHANGILAETTNRMKDAQSDLESVQLAAAAEELFAKGTVREFATEEEALLAKRGIVDGRAAAIKAWNKKHT